MERTLIELLLCGLLGLIGQGIRVVIGLKKLREESAAKANQQAAAIAGQQAAAAVDQQAAAIAGQQARLIYNQKFDVRELWLSLFIGFIAGCLVNFINEGAASSPEGRSAIIAAGYAGADFIEGTFKKVLPGQ